MADRRISQLNAADTLVENDLLVFADVSATETKRITGENLGLAMVQFGTTRGSDVPSSPANGQLWVDTSNNPPQLKIYNGAEFSLVSEFEDYADITSPGTSQPSTPVEGQLWLDTNSSPATLKVYETASASFIPVVNAISQTAGDERYLQITTAASTYLPLAGGTLTGTLTLDADPTANLQAATKQYVDTEVAGVASSDNTPAGTVIWTARQTAPTGYLICDGSLVSRSTYATLYSAIGTTFGAGDGTTFGLPDLRGQFVRGWNSGANDQSIASDVDSGRVFGSNQTDQLQQHTHTVAYTQVDNEGPNNIGDTIGNTNATKATNFGQIGRFGDETRPVNVALLACIKT